MAKETKNEKFVRLATARVNKIAKDLELLGNLSFQGNYEYSESEVEQIFSYVDQKVAEMKLRFSSPSAKKARFSLTEKDENKE